MIGIVDMSVNTDTPDGNVSRFSSPDDLHPGPSPGDERVRGEPSPENGRAQSDLP